MKYLILMFSFIILSCSENNPTPVNHFSVDAKLRIYLKDMDGMNLLNSPNYQSANFRIYNEINGQPVEVFNPQSDTPRNFSIDNSTNPISMVLYMNYLPTQPSAKTYVKWNETDTDTIKTSYIQNSSYAKCIAIWLNDELAWDQSTPSEGTGRSIIIVK